MCFILYILYSSSLCRSLRDSFEFRCGIYVVALVVHSCFSYVMCSWKCASKFLRWTPPSFFMRYTVRVVGDLIRSVFVILGMFSAPPYLANICCMRPL